MANHLAQNNVGGSIATLGIEGVEKHLSKYTAASDKGSIVMKNKNEEDINKLSNPIDFMNGALERVENKIKELEDKILLSKDIIRRQEDKIKTEVIAAKKEVLLNDSGTL